MQDTVVTNSQTICSAPLSIILEFTYYLDVMNWEGNKLRLLMNKLAYADYTVPYHHRYPYQRWQLVSLLGEHALLSTIVNIAYSQ